MSISLRNAFSVKKFKGDRKEPLYKYTCYIEPQGIGYKDCQGKWTSNPEEMCEAKNNPELQKDLQKKGTIFKTSYVEDIQGFIRKMDINEFCGDAYYFEKVLYLSGPVLSLSGTPHITDYPCGVEEAVDGIRYVIEHDLLF